MAAHDPSKEADHGGQGTPEKRLSGSSWGENGVLKPGEKPDHDEGAGRQEHEPHVFVSGGIQGRRQDVDAEQLSRAQKFPKKAHQDQDGAVAESAADAVQNQGLPRSRVDPVVGNGRENDSVSVEVQTDLPVTIERGRRPLCNIFAGGFQLAIEKKYG